MLREPVLNPEDQLLVSCGRPAFDEAVFSRLCSEVRDWDALLRKAARHRVILRLHAFLKQIGAGGILEPAAWRKIEEVSRLTQFRVMALEAELSETLLPRFNQAGIEPLLLKGLALNRTVYAGKPCRSFKDLDLLIHPNEAGRARSVLEGLGYQEKQDSHFPSRWHERVLSPLLPQNAISFFHAERRVPVDLHLEPFGEDAPVRWEPDWLWKEARPVPVGDSSAWIPHPDRLFLHLLFHLAKHIGRRQNFLGWYLDLDECLRYPGGVGEGDFCRAEIEKQPVAGEAFQILGFLQTHFETPLSFPLKEAIRARRIRPLPLEQLFLPEETLDISTFSDGGWIDRRETFFSYWDRVPGWGAKTWFLLRWIFPDGFYFEAKYPPFRTPSQKLRTYAKHFRALLYKGFYLLRYCLDRKKSYTEHQHASQSPG